MRHTCLGQSFRKEFPPFRKTVRTPESAHRRAPALRSGTWLEEFTHFSSFLSFLFLSWFLLISVRVFSGLRELSRSIGKCHQIVRRLVAGGHRGCFLHFNKSNDFILIVEDIGLAHRVGICGFCLLSIHSPFNNDTSFCLLKWNGGKLTLSLGRVVLVYHQCHHRKGQ